MLYLHNDIVYNISFLIFLNKDCKIKIKMANLEHKKNTLQGLTEEEVLSSRQLHGVNRLTPPEKEPLWKAFWEKFKDPLIIVLLVVMLFSLGVSCFEYFSLGASSSVFLEPLGVFVALMLATGVGFFFEVRAARAFDVLNQVNDDTPVKVIRCLDGVSQITEVPRHEVVVGDVVCVETGEEVPADGRLFEAVSLSVNEATLTGEPLAHKSADPEVVAADKHSAYAPDMVMKGSTVAEGHGLMQVLAVGDATEYGKVYVAAQIDDGVKTPLNRQLEQLGAILSKAAFVVAALIVVGRLVWFYRVGVTEMNDELIEIAHYVLNSIMIAVTLIVVSVPEGLPLSITLSLALAMKKMLKQNNLVRKLHACETMGAATVICTDKTGTLTQNRMQVAAMRNLLAEADVDRADDLLAEAIAVNSTAWLERGKTGEKVLGNPTEGALLLWLSEGDVDYLKVREECVVVSQQPFTTETKQMSTHAESAVLGEKVLYVKGAPEVLLARCSEIAGGIDRSEIEAQLLSYQKQAMRTLGFAMAREDQPEKLIFIALAAIADPIRQEVPEAIGDCMNAGIDVIIVTGDTPATAAEIGCQIGLIDRCDMADDGAMLRSRGEILTGPEFAAMSDEAILAILPRPQDGSNRGLKILSRARPLDKQRLVKLLQQLNHVVAVTGDGTNDAPALNAAQVGLSMGDGTAVAKEASDITIIDNSFSSIARAVMWGRSLYHNIGRFILFQMTVNVAACVVVLAGAFLGKESPLTVTQMLWVNLIMDTFAAMSLSSLPADPGVMREMPRRHNAHIIDRRMLLSILGWGFLMSGVLLACWLLPNVPHCYFFTIFVFMQFWNLFNARYYRTGHSFLGDILAGSRGRRAIKEAWSWGFVNIALLILIGQWLIVQWGGQMFHIERSFDLSEWAILLLVTLPIFVLGDLIRFFKKKKV